MLGNYLYRLLFILKASTPAVVTAKTINQLMHLHSQEDQYAMQEVIESYFCPNDTSDGENSGCENDDGSENEDDLQGKN